MSLVKLQIENKDFSGVVFVISSKVEIDIYLVPGVFGFNLFIAI